jgi:hypothetical protein
MFFTELVDAVRYSENWAESLENQTKARKGIESQVEALDELVSRVSGSFDGLGLEQEYGTNLSKIINEFVVAAVNQTRQRLDSRLKAALEESSSELSSEKLKAIKSLEAYLSVTPLPVLEEEVSLELSEGSYAASARYRCPEEIEYEFLLNTANSPLFRSQFNLAAFKKGARIPVRLAKTWLKKEPVPDYEKLEGYTLSKAQASKNHMTATFARDETGAAITVVYSKSNEESFVTVEYSDASGKMDITGEPALNKHLDIVFLRESMSRLVESVSELDREKLRLVRLEYDGVDVLATMKCLGFMQQVTKAIAKSRELLDAMRQLDPKTSMDRLKLLDERGIAIAGALGLGARSKNRQ